MKCPKCSNKNLMSRHKKGGSALWVCMNKECNHEFPKTKKTGSSTPRPTENIGGDE